MLEIQIVDIVKNIGVEACVKETYMHRRLEPLHWPSR